MRTGLEPVCDNRTAGAEENPFAVVGNQPCTRFRDGNDLISTNEVGDFLDERRGNERCQNDSKRECQVRILSNAWLKCNRKHEVRGLPE